MICEVCGRDVPQARAVIVEGTKLNVCPGCARFGEDYRSSSVGGVPVNQTVIDQRLERRERRMKSKDIYAGTASVELIYDYGRVIKAAREAKSMDLGQFAASIQERKGLLAKVEANNQIPDDKLIKKIEKALDIKLMETVQSGVTVGGQSSGKMTLSNFVRKE